LISKNDLLAVYFVVSVITAAELPPTALRESRDWLLLLRKPGSVFDSLVKYELFDVDRKIEVNRNSSALFINKTCVLVD